MGYFLFQHDIAPMHKARSIQKWFVEIGVEELYWSAQNPDLNPIEHLWDELERRLRARPNRPTSVPDLTNALMAEWKQIPAAMFQHLVDVVLVALSLAKTSGKSVDWPGGVVTSRGPPFSLSRGLIG